MSSPFLRLALAAASLAALAACTAPAPADNASTVRNEETPADIGVDMIGPQPGPAPELDAYPLAPSAGEACPDDGERLPLSGVCRGRAVNYMELDDATPVTAPEGCDWTVNETWFGGEVMLYRAIVCGDKKVDLEYAGGAHAAELSYKSSVLHPEAVPDPNDIEANHPIVRVATYWKDDDWRLKETIGSDANIARCEIRPAGPGYPTGAKVIAPKVDGADCGGYALSDTADNFWIVRPDYVYAFMLPKSERDIDPGSFVAVTPH